MLLKKEAVRNHNLLSLALAAKSCPSEKTLFWPEALEKTWNFGIFGVKMAKKPYKSTTYEIPIWF